jgi:NADH:ubiquinone oxidoreductase subunit K
MYKRKAYCSVVSFCLMNEFVLNFVLVHTKFCTADLTVVLIFSITFPLREAQIKLNSLLKTGRREENRSGIKCRSLGFT